MSSSATTVAITIVLSMWVFSTTNVVESAHHGGGAAAPAPAVDCSTVIVSMVDCLSYVTAGSVVKQPEGQCCSTLKTVLKTNAECLCEAFKNSAQLGVSLNITKALSLPTACHLHAPSVTNCGLSLGGAPAPAISPSAVSPGSFVMAPNTDIAPGPVQGSSSGSSMLVASALTLVFGLLVSASATTTSLF